MGANYFNKLRQSYIVKFVFTSILTNLMAFGQPLQQVITNYNSNSSLSILGSISSIPDIKFEEYSTPKNLQPSHSTEKNATETNVFYAVEEEVVVGKLFEADTENPRDNFFTVYLPESIDFINYDAVLVYDLYGLSNPSHTTKSINNKMSYGGKSVTVTAGWNTVTENIAVSHLKKGLNDIYFNRRTDKNYEYKIRNLRIKLIEKQAEIVTAENTLTNFKGTVYLVGFANTEIRDLNVLGTNIIINEGIFERVLTNVPKRMKELEIYYIDRHGRQHSKKFPLQYNDEQVSYHFESSALHNISSVYSYNDLVKTCFDYNNVLSITADEEYLQKEDSKVIVEGLTFKDIKTIDAEIVNVTAGDYASYRIRKINVPDSAAVKLHLKYDLAKIPDGYTAKDIKTFYYDKEQRTWKSLPPENLDIENEQVITTIYNNETDYINGIIKVPDSPETGSFAPTTIKDMKYADPAAGIVSIQPPSPNSTGAATTSFPLKLPQGRNGMQPSLQVTYNSEGGNGLMGVGWNLSTQAITLNTKWGAPLFEAANESELYLLDGADLVLKLADGTYTSPHRNINPIPRGSENTKEFYLRKEGSYQQIIRHGTSPSTYWWEVIDKHGNKSFYGGLPGNGVDDYSVMRTDSQHIAHWALKRVQDPHGNYIEYSYTKELNKPIGSSAVTGQKFNVNTIKYTLWGPPTSTPNYYQITFKRDSYSVFNGKPLFTRNDVVVNGRNGYFHIIDDLLREIQVSFVEGTQTKRIRTYRFDYEEKAFKKPQLTEISEFDTNGDLFYSNTIEYYNDTFGQPSLISGSQPIVWDGDHDDISMPTDLLPLGSLVPKGSPLGTSTGTGFSFGLRSGFGLGITTSVSLSAGGSFNYSENTQKTKISFIDINGDGLSDKVIDDNGTLTYRPNITNQGSFGVDFQAPLPLTNLDDLTRVKSRTIGGGVDANVAGAIGVGQSWSTTTSETDNYFTDFNGDGLPDMVSGGLVRFNTTAAGNNYMYRTFENDANTTENPINSGVIDQSLSEYLYLPTMVDLREQHSQFDHVKVWKAPYTGTININAPYSVIPTSGAQANQFRFTVEKAVNNQTTGYTTYLANPQYSTSGQYVLNGVQVNKGDILFFRAHNMQYGYGGEVTWNPAITYSDMPTLLQTLPTVVSDENGNNIKDYSAQFDYIMNNGSGISFNNEIVDIDFNLNSIDPYEYSGDIRFIIRQERIYLTDGTQSVVNEWVRTYNHLNGTISPISQLINDIPAAPTGYMDNYIFFVESDANVDWNAINWNPKITGSTSGLKYPSVQYDIYDENVNGNKYWFDASQLPTVTIANSQDYYTPILRVSHNFFDGNYGQLLNYFEDEEFPLKVNWVVKTKSTVVQTLHTKTFYIHKTTIEDPLSNTWNYVFTETDDLTTQIDPAVDIEFSSYDLTKQQVKDIKDAVGGKLFSAFYVNNRKVTVTGADIAISTLTTNPPTTIAALGSPFWAATPSIVGTTYRGWGQFLYNGGVAYNRTNTGELIEPVTLNDYSGKIEMGLFNYDSQADAAQTIEDNPGGVNIDNRIRYTFYNPVNQTNHYENTAIINSRYGFNSYGVLTATLGRFGEDNLYDIYVDPDDVFSDDSGIFFGMKQRSESKGSTTSGNLGFGSGSISTATSRVLNQYMDLNGDRYPDVVTSGKIQYTNMRGALSSKVELNNHVSGDNSTDRFKGINVSAIPPNSTESSKTTGNKTNNNANAGINQGDGETTRSTQWVDMNGDGLTDKVLIEGGQVKVYLNNGYSFSGEVNWGAATTSNVSERSNYGVGGGFSFGASFAAGLGATDGQALMNVMFIDVNGDGFPDLVERKNNQHIYYLNTGAGFGPGALFYNSNYAEEDRTLSGNIFGSFTWGIPVPILMIPFKLVFSPSAGVNCSVNHKLHTIQDINGDGLADILRADGQNSTKIAARLNIVGKTHLLKTVNTPMGGYWTINYERLGNTYDMPHSKWVVNKIETFDGFTQDNDFKPGSTLTEVVYTNPKYDRREREFFGFGTVSIQQKDPENPTQMAYRVMQTDYHNNNYYLSGLEKEKIIYAGGQFVGTTKTLYNLLDPDDPIVNMDADDDNNYLQQSLIPDAEELLDQSRLFAAVAKVTTITNETPDQLTAVKEFAAYNNKGNITTYIDHGEGGDDAYKTVITYFNTPPANVANGYAFPKNISVYKNLPNGELLRQREATYTDKGKLSSVTTKLNDNENNNVSFQYDTYGNLTAVTQTNNLNEAGTAPFVQTIAYDPVLNTFPVTFTNSFGEESTMVYNYLFGTPVYTEDMNGEKMRTRIDDRGRVVEVTGPNEMAIDGATSAWTIRMEYKGETAITGNMQPDAYMLEGNGTFRAIPPGTTLPDASHHAVTRHFDPENANGTPISNNQFITISIVDGFGQAIQVKKNHVSDSHKWLVSGFERKDAFGRTLETYLPIPGGAFDATSLPTSYQNTPYGSPLFLAPVVMEYDHKDRVRKVYQPGETVFAAIEYSIVDNMVLQKTINEEGQTSETFTDIRGRVRKTVQNEEIETKFEYNAINELLSVTDNENFVTNYKYDLAGRKIEMQHPDRGVITFKYDPAGRMIEQSNSNLLVNQQKITYFYDHSRLVRINYPQNPQNQVKYTYGEPNDPLAEAENAVGRLLMQEDATGVQVFGYGLMGEVTKNLKSVAVAGYASYWFFTKWKYDSWNRIQEITYPDKEVVSYVYDNAGQLQKITSTITGLTGVQNVVNRIAYNDQGQRSSIEYGNGTVTNYVYDVRQRMTGLTHALGSFSITKNYTYDLLSNILEIKTDQPQTSLPGGGAIGGPVNHYYTYDDYNRLIHAEGDYTGPNDMPGDYLQQEYTLDMEYNTDHTIKKKTQVQNHGVVSGYGGNITNPTPVRKNTYVIDYDGYATGQYVTTNGNSSYGYAQPHAPREITETPNGLTGLSQDDPRIKRKTITYDRNGNQTEIKQTVGQDVISLRKNMWDEENRLIAVDLKPDEPTNHPVAIYTYNAAGERTVRYNYDRIDVFSNGTEIDQDQDQVVPDNVMLYPSGLLMGKAIHAKDDRNERIDRINYTKHYYIGSERISAKTGTVKDLGQYPEEWLSSSTGSNIGMPALSTGATVNSTTIYDASWVIVGEAGATVSNTYSGFGLQPPTLSPKRELKKLQFTHVQAMFNQFYFHPDHLGSSSYVTNHQKIIIQHMEYLPFGETLVDEHTNSFNSPFKYNGKEIDEETGNYYYGARYYDPKWSIWISVDPLAEKYPSISAYAYVANNPINAIDPDGERIIYIIRGGEGNKPSTYTYRNGNFYDKNNRIFVPDEKKQATMYKVLKSYQKIESSNNDILKGQLKKLETSKQNHYIEQSPNGENAVTVLHEDAAYFGKPADTQTEFTLGSDFASTFETVVHELRHQFDYDIGNMTDKVRGNSATDPEEIRAVYNGNIAREIMGKEPRDDYGGVKIDPEKLKNPPNNIQPDDL